MQTVYTLVKYLNEFNEWDLLVLKQGKIFQSLEEQGGGEGGKGGGEGGFSEARGHVNLGKM